MKKTMFLTNRFNNSIRNRYQRGAVMVIDYILWSGGVLIAMAFLFWVKNSGYPKAQGWMEASTVSANMDKIFGIYNGAAALTGLNTAAVANNTIFQAKYLPGAGVVRNRFGGTVTIGTQTTTVADDTMRYTETGIPSPACPTLANQAGDDVDVITIAGTVVKANGAAINPTTLNTQCNSAATVTIIFDKIKQG